MANPVEGDSTDPSIAGVKGTNAATSAADATGVFGEGTIGVTGFGILVGVKGEGPPTPNFVAVRGDGGGIPGLGGAPTFGVIGTTASLAGIGVQGVNQSGGTAGDFQGRVNVTGDMTVSGNINVGGDVFLTNKDVAEHFEVDTSVECQVGMVMVLGDAGPLVPCFRRYDKRAIGVVSGAGGLHPAITLGAVGAVETPARTAPIALVGTAFCLADADFGPIEAGDPVTSSETLGHAMKAADPVESFCAIIGKALAPLHKGRGVIPILIVRQ